MNETQIRASDAESLLANPVFKGAFERMREVLESKMLRMDTDNLDACARIVISKQLLKGIEREINRYIKNGEIQNLVELEAIRRKPRDVAFQR